MPYVPGVGAPGVCGEDDKDIIGIWSCTSCRMLPTLVERLLEKTSMLESLVVKLERSNQQLLSLMGEQSQEIRRLREDIATSKRQDGDADSNDGGPQAVTLLLGNSLLRDVGVDKTSSGNPGFDGNQAPLPDSTEIRRHSCRYRTNDR